jgi:transmembrane sensor
MTKKMNYRSSEEKPFKEMGTGEKILSRAAGLRTPGDISAQEALSDFHQRLNASVKENPTKNAVVRPLILRLVSVAAVILIILGLWISIPKGGNTRIIAGRGHHIGHTLPDGSKVEMNAESRLVYPKKDFNGDRRVNLDGEAFFNVVKGRSFIVSTKYGKVEVMGTSFNVCSRDNIFRVSCVTGKVRVSAGDNSVIILPGESTELGNGSLTTIAGQTPESSTGWMQGKFSYENSPLSQVFNEIERQFNIKFVAGDLKARFFTGSFTNKDLKDALDIVCIPMGLAYEVGDKGKVYIKEKTRL